MKQFKKLLAPLFSILVALLLGTALIWACGYEPFRAYSALLKGAFGSVRYALATLEKSVPMILCGLAAVVAMKSGIFNIGAEGQLYIGALAYTAAALYLDFLPGVIHLAVCLAAAIAGGALWALIPAVMKVRLRINEVVTSIMLNYTAKLLIAFLVSGPMKAPGDVSQSEAIPASAAIGEIAAGGKITWGFMLAIVLCVVVWVIFRHTSFGYDITAAGMNDRAAAAGGIHPDQVRLQAMLISGGLAGLAGGLLVASAFGRLVIAVSTGYGFDGISIAVLGLYSPVGVFLSSVLFGALRTGSLYMEMFVHIPSELIDVLQGIIIVVIASPALFQMLIRRREKSHDK